MTTDMGPVISAVDGYGDQRFAEGAASRQTEVDGLAQQRDALRTQVDAAEKALADHMATHQPDPEPEPPTPARTLRIGMNAIDQWDQRLAQVGRDGITARRIFVKDIANPRERDSQVQAAIRDGMMPILSLKGTPTTGNVKTLRDYLVGLKVDVTATYFHEPRGDVSPADFIARSKVFLGAQAPNVKVGPLLNGWLLDGKVAEFASYTDPELLKRWDFMGLDTYETMGKIPGDRIPPLVKWLREQGQPDKPIVVGEYNGKSAKSIADSGEMFLSTPQVIVACIWNATGTGSAEATPLEGDRLAAFKATKADARVTR